MRSTVSDHLIQRLSDWGIKRIYGYPGDGVNGLYGALQRALERFEYVQARHEEMAAFMACAHAKFTGQTGVCIATSGPGAIHLLNGLYDAKLDHQPVVAIVGQQARAALGGSYQQEVDLANLFKDVAGDYLNTISVPAQTRHVVDRALRIAQSMRTVTAIILPNDVQQMAAMETPERGHGTIHSSSGVRMPRVLPAKDDLQRAADILNEGERVAILAGAGALEATDQVVQVAEKLGAGVAKALLGKAAVPDDLSYVTGAIGLLGTRPSWNMMTNCDTLLMIGSRFPYSEFLPKEGQARGVQIDLDPQMLGIRYPMEVNLTGDSAATLEALLPLLKEREASDWQQGIEQDVADWWKVMEARAKSPASPLNPQRVFWELSSRLPDNCILASDSGSAANWYARDLRIRRGIQASLSGTLASMGCGVPYAIAAKFAFPDRAVIALVGDGAMQMNGNSELITIAHYWRRWRDPRLIVMVLNNGDLNQVTWEQRAMVGNPKFEESQTVPAFNYAGYAELLGLKGIRVDDPDSVGAAWDEALSADRPVLLEAVTDPNVPPLPPHITLEQATAYVSSMWHGDPDRLEVIRASARQLLDALMPERRTEEA